MSGDAQVELWLHEYKMNALAAVLARENSSVEQRMQDALTELYVELVPREVRQEISARIKEEYTVQQLEIEAARKYAVFHVQEDGREEYFRLDQTYELLQAAQALRKYLRQEPEADVGSFFDLFSRRETITLEEFDQMVLLRMENTGMVTGAFDLDFDKREFSAVNIMDGWKTFAMGDVSAAAYHAFHKERLNTDGRYRILLDKLEGKEITSAGHLSAREISFAEEISEIDGLLNFYMQTDFDVDGMFGTHVCTAENDDCLNVYANYDMAEGAVCDELEVDLHWADGREEAVPYTLNAAEKEVLRWKMDEYCQRQTGQSLEAYSAQLLAESQVLEPPDGPVM